MSVDALHACPKNVSSSIFNYFWAGSSIGVIINNDENIDNDESTSVFDSPTELMTADWPVAGPDMRATGSEAGNTLVGRNEGCMCSARRWQVVQHVFCSSLRPIGLLRTTVW